MPAHVNGIMTTLEIKMHKHLKNSHRKIIEKLKDITSPAKIDKISKGKRLYELHTQSQKKVLFIMEGDYIIRSKINNKIIDIVSAPFVIGVTPSLEPLQVYIECIDFGRIHSMEYTQFWSVVNHQDLITEVMRIISGYHSMIINCLQLHHANTEEQFKKIVFQWGEFPESVKSRFSLLFFVVNTLSVSKSTACRFLSKMKNEGVIETDNGKLVAHNIH